MDWTKVFAAVWPWVRQQGLATVLLLLLMYWLLGHFTPFLASVEARHSDDMRRLIEEFHFDQERDHQLLQRLLSRDWVVETP